jgi:hypothetical protein
MKATIANLSSQSNNYDELDMPIPLLPADDMFLNVRFASVLPAATIATIANITQASVVPEKKAVAEIQKPNKKRKRPDREVIENSGLRIERDKLTEDKKNWESEKKNYRLKLKACGQN